MSIDRCEELVIGERHVERDHRRRRAQPLHVPIEQERLAVVGAGDFVHALAVEEAVIEHRDGRTRAISDPAVDVDEHAHSSAA